MSEITENFLNSKEISDYLNKVKEISPIKILGLSDVAKACIIQMTKSCNKKSILVVTYNELQAQNLQKNLKAIGKNAIYMPKKEIITYQYDAQSMDILHSRIDAIIKMYEKQAEIVVISAETLITPILSKRKMNNCILKFLVANEYNLEEIKEKLVALGYERCDLTQGKGTFSQRGDILDIALSSKQGVRIEFFGDEVDQIRYYDMQSQRSTENIKQIKIYPVSEEVEKEPNGNILEYLEKDNIIIFDEINKIELRVKNILEDNILLIKNLIEKEKQVPYILEHMYNLEQILKITNDYQNINLESQDLTSDKDAIILKHEDVKKIEDKFYEITKQEREQRTYKPKRRSSEFRDAEKITFSDLRIGDYVVHKNHGIGQYIGVNTMKADGIIKDYIKIKYAGDDVLYIPTNSLDNIRKYVGGGEKAPKINRLGTKEWENTKNKVKSNLREVARNLVELYAKRNKIKGYAFEKDTPWQKEFEEAFPYTETEDQLRCIQEVKQDMEKQKPMDRLLCRRCRIPEKPKLQ